MGGLNEEKIFSNYLVLPSMSSKLEILCYEKCLSHITEHSRTGNYSAMTHLCKNLPERSIHYVIYSN